MPRLRPADNQIAFLGTGGARIVVTKQVRASGGILFRLGGVNILVDPGPGSLLRLLQYLPDFSPIDIDGIIISHRHLDHAASVNVMIEAMTEAGRIRHGVLIAPHDALEEDPVVLRYLRGFLERVETLREGARFRLGPVEIEAPLRHHHRVETYGLRFKVGDRRVAYIPDSKYFPRLARCYRSDLAIISLLRAEPSEVDHLSIPDVRTIIRATKPKMTFLTHFGMPIIKLGPEKVARRLARETGAKVRAARDGEVISVNRVLRG